PVSCGASAGAPATGPIHRWLCASANPMASTSTGPRTVITFLTDPLILWLQDYPQIGAIGGGGNSGIGFGQRAAGRHQGRQLYTPGAHDLGSAQAVIGAARRRTGDDQLFVVHRVAVKADERILLRQAAKEVDAPADRGDRQRRF